LHDAPKGDQPIVWESFVGKAAKTIHEQGTSNAGGPGLEVAG